MRFSSGLRMTTREVRKHVGIRGQHYNYTAISSAVERLSKLGHDRTSCASFSSSFWPLKPNTSTLVILAKWNVRTIYCGLFFVFQSRAKMTHADPFVDVANTHKKQINSGLTEQWQQFVRRVNTKITQCKMTNITEQSTNSRRQSSGDERTFINYSFTVRRTLHPLQKPRTVGWYGLRR